jgi:hypothetical protein
MGVRTKVYNKKMLRVAISYTIVFVATNTLIYLYCQLDCYHLGACTCNHLFMNFVFF